MTRKKSVRTTRTTGAPRGLRSLACGPLVRPLVAVLVLGVPAVLLPGLAVVSRASALDATATAVQQPTASGRAAHAPEDWRWALREASVSTETQAPVPDVPVQSLERATPEHLVLPALGVDAPVVPVGLDPSRQMEVPDDVATVGWYEPSAGRGVVPGATGTAVLAGHVNSLTQGTGAFADLAQLVVGDEVLVGLTDGQAQRWSVVSIERHPKDRLPLDELFVWDGPPRLALVTCGGTFDPRTGSHRDNIVVIAVPQGTDAPTA
jgi:sortase (surface protein transpeptidase)